MKPQQDPVVQNLNEWINRSAGQHKRYASEGHESAKRILGDMRRVDTSQLGQRDGVSVGACRTDLPIEYAGQEPTFFNEVEQLKREGQAAFVIVMMILALALVAFYSFTA